MLSSNDLAELIESTRDRVKYMGGESPAAAGVVQVLNGLITVLRDQVQEDDSPAEPVEAEVETATTAPADEPETESSDEQLPGYLQHLRSQRRAGGARRRPVRENYNAPPKASNPLLNPQYSGFFNALIAQQKAPESRPPAREENGNAEDAPPESVPEQPGSSAADEPPRTFRDETATG